jgi:hypothetical protein
MLPVMLSIMTLMKLSESKQVGEAVSRDVP